MSLEEVYLNRPQNLSVLSNAKSEVSIHGRGTGKSFIIGWEISQIVRLMPRSVSSITGRTYGQIYSRTLPSTLKFLGKLGIEKDKDFVIGIKPPKKLAFLEPYEKITRYDNFISFSNGTGFLMLSQERQGSSRGPNIDREIVDEALTLNKQRYDEEVSPANRGNEELWGFKAPQEDKVIQHHGFRYVSSMPYTLDQRWLLKFGDYYEQEAGIHIYDIWNRIVKLQIQLIESQKAGDKILFKNIWNEIVRLKLQIAPFVSKEGLLFTLANAFDNLDNLGMSYIIREFEKQNLLTFMVEILNWIPDQVEDCYYHLDSSQHIYYDAIDNDYIRDIAENTNWNTEQLSAENCRFDLDCDPHRPIEIVPDWGSKIALFSVAQERNYNFVTKMMQSVDCTINEFFVRSNTPGVMIDDLVDKFCKYYLPHPTKTIIYFRDRYGDSRQPNAKNSKTYNEQAIDRFTLNGWTVDVRVHKGQEPPQHDKYLLWMNILKGNDIRYPNFLINGHRCKYTIISMNNTKVTDKDGKFAKDKSSEQKHSILPEEATHFGDAVDKRMWTKYSNLVNKYNSTFIAPRI
jgi:hypothetical protein